MTAATQPKLQHYHWQGQDARGSRQCGEMPATSSALVKAQLRRQGLHAIRVRRKRHTLLGATHASIKQRDIILFIRQLATLLQTGIPLVQCFEIIAQGLIKPRVRELVLRIHDDVAAGHSLTETMRRHPRQFDTLASHLIEAGEQSGTLDTMLDRLATHMEKSAALKTRIRKALQYPLTVLVVALLVTGILLIKVVPQFADTFASFGADLPAFTRQVMALSTYAIQWWPWMLASLVGTGCALRVAQRHSPRFADTLESWALKAPVLGSILGKAALARFTRTLATTFAAGVPLPDGLTSSAGASGNARYRHALLQVRDDISTGLRFAQALRAQRLFPALILQMVAIGEESGALDRMLARCAAAYEAEVDQAVDGLTALLEPLIMVVLGVLVGGLMVAMYLPLFRIGSVI